MPYLISFNLPSIRLLTIGQWPEQKYYKNNNGFLILNLLQCYLQLFVRYFAILMHHKVDLLIGSMKDEWTKVLIVNLRPFLRKINGIVRL